MNESQLTSLGRLLVVDDETSLVSALLATLRESGYTAVGVTNPTDALRLLRAERFDVLISDLHLPDMDGIELLRAALQIDPSLIVIMMTGHGTIDTAVEAMKAGAMDYIQKPFKLKAILALLARALAQRNLRLENEALQRRLVARTNELEAANADLEAFSYSVSHDLRAPLRSIQGFTELLLEESANGSRENADDYGRRINKGVRRLETIIEDLLRLAKASRAEINRMPVELGGVARDVFAKLQTQAPDRVVELVVGPDLTTVGDAGLLRLALENLLGNAWKYSSRREAARLEIGATGSGAEKVFFVRDNGVGFDMAEAKHLFVPFRRLGSAIGFEGTGIGLATVQRIVRRHGGRIWADSRVGEGSTFSFVLPETGAGSVPPLPRAGAITSNVVGSPPNPPGS